MWEQYSHIIGHIEVDSGVIANVPSWLTQKGYKNPLVVMDINTRVVAGDTLCQLLTANQIRHAVYCYSNPFLTSDETAIGQLTAAYHPDFDVLIAVGSGTINDLCKYVSLRVNRPFVVVGTAPSMDGYASKGAAMTINGMKVTPQTACPEAIFCDTAIMKNAPMLMMAAGLGDVLGKYNALADWKLSHILTGESMPESIVKLVSDAIEKCAGNVDGVLNREENAIKDLCEGLILSGLAMSLYGDSRPASGTEHHMSHYWEMRFIIEGKTPVLHGIKVGITTICALRMWKSLPAQLTAPKKEDRDKTIKLVTELYGSSSAALVGVPNPNLSFAKITENYAQILDIAKSLPEPEYIAGLLSKLSAPITPASIAVDEQTLKDSVLLARERKKTYTLLQLLGDLGLLEHFSAGLTDYFSSKALVKTKLFVLDMDGTIYLGDNLFDYTKKCLSAISDSGRDYVFFTNNSSKSKAKYLSKLEKMGIPVTAEKMLISTEVLIKHLIETHQGARLYVSGTTDLLDDFKLAGFDTDSIDPDVVVIGFDTSFTYEKLQKITKAVQNGAVIYGVNTDLLCPMPDGYIPDCGSLAAAITAATGVTIKFFGKPSVYARKYISEKTGYQESEICFVGDRLYTDIAIANSSDAVSALVLSGETKREDIRGSKHVADIVAESLEELVSKF